MKQIMGIWLAVCLLMSGCCQVPVYAEVTVSAEACVLLEATTGQVIFEKNAYEKRPMASTTKIMTTLLCLESGQLDEPFLVDTNAIHVEGSSMGLQEGDIVTKRALCYGMLLPSGNDAANAAAVAVAGDTERFAERMNARAAEIGMTRTCFVTPSGLDAPGHGASAHDMALLAREALKNPDFRAICGMESAAVTFGNPPYERRLYNSNKLLTMCEGVIGVKTGFTDEAGRCLVSACERNGITLICVTLHAPDDWQDHIRLYEEGFSQVTPVTLDVPEDLSQKVVGGTVQEVAITPKEPIVIGALYGDASSVTCRVQLAPFAYAPLAVGETVGTLQYYYNTECIAEVPLFAAEPVLQQTMQPSVSFFAAFWQWLTKWITNT